MIADDMGGLTSPFFAAEEYKNDPRNPNAKNAH